MNFFFIHKKERNWNSFTYFVLKYLELYAWNCAPICFPSRFCLIYDDPKR